MSDKVEIKELHNKDVIMETLKRFGDSLFDQTVNQQEMLSALGRKYTEKAQVIAVTKDSGFIGLCAYYDNDQSGAFISMFVIDRAYQHQGYGTKMLNEVIRRCRQEGVRCIKLEVDEENRNAVDFYMKNGFRLQKKNQDKQIMKLKLG